MQDTMDPLQQEMQNLKAEMKQKLSEDVRILRKLRQSQDAYAAFCRNSPPTLQKHLEETKYSNVETAKHNRNDDSWSTSSLNGSFTRNLLQEMSTHEKLAFIQSHLV